MKSENTFDFETHDVFELTINVGDNGVPRQSTSTKVLINIRDSNEPPYFQRNVIEAYRTIEENSAGGTLVDTVTAVDKRNIQRS